MKKKVYFNMLALTLIGIILTSILLISVFYNLFDRQVEKEVKDQAEFFQESLNYSSENLSYINSLELTNKSARLSIISYDGKVIFDSFASTENMENHFDRPEFKQALENGIAQSTRYSNTLGERTYYYAIRLDDKSVLRLAKTTNSIYNVFASTIPMLVIIIIISFVACNVIAIKLTSRIVEPINNVVLDEEQEDIYEELAPFIKTIKLQKEQINKQFSALEDRANTIKIMTENIKEGILVTNKNGSILLVNSSALAFFDAKSQDYIGKNTLEFIRNVDLQKGIGKAISGESSDIIIQNGKIIIQVFLSPVYANGNLNGAIALFLDISERYSAEKMRKEFSANVSHELKTPLTTIVGFSEMMSNDMVKQNDIKKFACKIKDESTRLIALIEDIIKISEIDENSAQSQFTMFDVKALVADILTRLQPIADSKNISLAVKGDKDIIKADNQMIFEMLYNLVENAIKYNKINGEVVVTISKLDSKTKIEIYDTGIGISNAHVERIFERFYRVDKSRSKKTGGTGLGLSIVKHIVEYHSGYVNVESEIGVGTKIIVTI